MSKITNDYLSRHGTRNCQRAALYAYTASQQHSMFAVIPSWRKITHHSVARKCITLLQERHSKSMGNPGFWVAVAP